MYFLEDKTSGRRLPRTLKFLRKRIINIFKYSKYEEIENLCVPFFLVAFIALLRIESWGLFMAPLWLTN